MNLPLGTTAPVTTTSANVQLKTLSGAGSGTDRALTMTNSGNTLVGGGTAPGGNVLVAFGSNTGLQADLSTATAATINSLRLAFQVQRMYERDARGGTRYVEILKAHFNVTSPDFRLQRPEYLGGNTKNSHQPLSLRHLQLMQNHRKVTLPHTLLYLSLVQASRTRSQNTVTLLGSSACEPTLTTKTVLTVFGHAPPASISTGPHFHT